MSNAGGVEPMPLHRATMAPGWPAPAITAGRRARRSTGTGQPIAADLPFARVEVHASMAAAAEAWAQLERVAPMSPYQRHDWIATWVDTEGAALAVTPAIAVARDGCDRPVALLPFGIVRTGWLRRAIFLGGRSTNYNLGLFDPSLPWTPGAAAALLQAAAQGTAGGVDLFALVNQPLAWGAFANPLAALPNHQPSPSFAHRAELLADPEAFLKAHLSGPARKKLRAKATHLATLGAVDHRVARSAAEVEAVVEAHLAQKVAKLATLGIAPPDTGTLRRLLVAAALPSPGRGPTLELHALVCGEAIVATFGGLAHADRFSGLLISYSLEPAFARNSPGELLLAAVIRAKCEAGFAGFDLGIGEARYKGSFCPLADPLVDTLLPLTLRGRAAAAGLAGALRAKAAIKRSPRAWALTQALRKRLGQTRGG